MAKMNPGTEPVGVVAVQDMTTAGAIIWWSLRGELALPALETAWTAANFDAKLLPKGPTVAECMARSARACQSKRFLARPLSGRRGWALVAETPTYSGDLAYATAAKMHLDDCKSLQIDGADDSLHQTLKMSFAHHKAMLSATDVSMWLSARLIPRVEAVKLRTTGGVYFVPRQHLMTFRAWAQVLRDVSDHAVYEVPALQSDEAVAAILAALIAEADTEIDALETELDTEELGSRAIKTREAKCEALRRKLETYADLLGVSVAQTNVRLGNVRAALVESSMNETL